jgi:hypothetical protein
MLVSPHAFTHRPYRCEQNNFARAQEETILFLRTRAPSKTFVTVLTARRGAVPSRLDRLERPPSDFVISRQTSQFRVEPSCITNLLIRIKRENVPLAASGLLGPQPRELSAHERSDVYA